LDFCESDPRFERQNRIRGDKKLESTENEEQEKKMRWEGG
jgi:hypothetical protein